jgi:hypothetical protein
MIPPIHPLAEVPLAGRAAVGRPAGLHEAAPRALAPGVSVPQFRDKNRRGIGKAQSKWTAYTMETPAHLSTHNLRHPVHCSRQRAQEGSDS